MKNNLTTGDVLSAGSSVAGSLIAANSAKKISLAQIKAVQEAHERERKEALEDRAHAEIYNSPAMQRLRMENAGFSPQEYVDAGSSDVPTPVDYASGLDSAYSNLAGAGAMASQIAPSAINSLIAQSQIRHLESQIDLNTVRSDNISENTRGLKLDNYIRNATKENQIAISKLQEDTLFQNLKKGVAELKLIAQQSDLNESSKKLLGLQIELDEKVLQSRVALAKLSVKYSELDLKTKDFNLNYTLPKDLQVKDSEIRKNGAYNRLLGAQYDFVVESTKNATKEGLSIDLRNNNQRIVNTKMDAELRAFQKTYNEYVENLKNKYHLTEVEARYAGAKFWIDSTTKVVDTAIKGVATYYGAGLLGGKTFSPLAPVSAGTSMPQAGYNPYPNLNIPRSIDGANNDVWLP